MKKFIFEVTCTDKYYNEEIKNKKSLKQIEDELRDCPGVRDVKVEIEHGEDEPAQVSTKKIHDK